jgi:hypothetical protein
MHVIRYLRQVLWSVTARSVHEHMLAPARTHTPKVVLDVGGTHGDAGGAHSDSKEHSIHVHRYLQLNMSFSEH